MSAQDGFANVRHGHFAFFCEETDANSVILRLFKNHEICETKKILIQRSDTIGIILKKHSPLRERFIINYLWTNEVGVLFKILRHWNGMKLTCTPNSHFQSVRIEYLAPIFWILILAHILSFLIFFGEVFVKKICFMKRRNLMRR